jgi:thiosulfate/3-mercaptopyruvate sulfurtransferase
LEVQDKMFVDMAAFRATVHGEGACTLCHAGRSDASDKDTAHQGLIADPSADPDKICGPCHPDVAKTAVTSLHYTFRGLEATFKARGSEASQATLQKANQELCGQCHVTCGQCHVARPTTNQGGLLQGHVFVKQPPMEQTCQGCHGTRVTEEYRGVNDGLGPDVHWSEAEMMCFDCHGKAEIHGDGQTYQDRYEGPAQPDCLKCHDRVRPGNSGIEQHDVHKGRLSCQVCHAVQYTNCFGCHGARDTAGKLVFFDQMVSTDLKIGRNYRQSRTRPWDYVVVRHVPIARDTYDVYAPGLLPNYDALPTWKYATPHNIHLKTPQNESCESCHDQPQRFLLEKDVDPDERQANKDVIVPQAPPLKTPTPTP